MGKTEKVNTRLGETVTQKDGKAKKKWLLEKKEGWTVLRNLKL